MAQRDRAQGFAFVYVDIAKLLQENGKVREDSPLLIPDETQSVHVPKNASAPHSSAVKQIQQNLDRLSALHHKLHAMLEELNQITGKKKS